VYQSPKDDLQSIREINRSGSNCASKDLPNLEIVKCVPSGGSGDINDMNPVNSESGRAASVGESSQKPGEKPIKDPTKKPIDKPITDKPIKDPCNGPTDQGRSIVKPESQPIKPQPINPELRPELVKPGTAKAGEMKLIEENVPIRPKS
ncbi:MAG: hypothetical protein K8F91_18295, partial [Candidatus Obscuribacterales bacterium]|nr:hypothetical protein [Candidatus Obscuribacterales bacterium]